MFNGPVLLSNKSEHSLFYKYAIEFWFEEFTILKLNFYLALYITDVLGLTFLIGRFTFGILTDIIKLFYGVAILLYLCLSGELWDVYKVSATLWFFYLFSSKFNKFRDCCDSRPLLIFLVLGYLYRFILLCYYVVVGNYDTELILLLLLLDNTAL